MKILVTHDELVNAGKLHTSEAGERTRLTFLWTLNDKGEKILVKDKEIDQQDEINSYLEETKIENIIKRATFDPSLWEKFNFDLGSEAMVADYTGMPTTLADAQKIMMEAEQRWEDLPREIKAKFDNSVDKFLHMFGTAEWATAMGLTKREETATEATGEVKE